MRDGWLVVNSCGVWCSVVQCGAVWCSVVQCGAVGSNMGASSSWGGGSRECLSRMSLENGHLFIVRSPVSLLVFFFSRRWCRSQPCGRIKAHLARARLESRQGCAGARSDLAAWTEPSMLQLPAHVLWHSRGASTPPPFTPAPTSPSEHRHP